MWILKSLLDNITFPEDLRKLKRNQLPLLAKELREFIINEVATKGGHLGASLGVIELTIALHYLFDTPNDLIVWDVGHQAYGHKILTGRKKDFHTNRQFGGISGFPSREESIYDTFGVGHSSTSISAALGMAIVSKLNNHKSRQHIAVIGDASLASGIAFEALNHAGVSDANLLIILNDNSIGIDPSVGALKAYLTKVKKDKKIASQNNIIKALNFNYFGPVDGHDLTLLLSELEKLSSLDGPKFLHVITTKGKGLKKAEEDQITYHAPGKFDKITGERIIGKETVFTKYQDVFGLSIKELAQKNRKIVAITPAMLSGSSLRFMQDKFPERTFDVGIAEQHAVTLAAGMAANGFIPFCVIYSTFLQRAYDQVIHDVALQSLPVIFCIDRAGLVGEDGATHHGVFDISYLRSIPNLVLAAPRNEIELRNMLFTFQKGISQPVAIRYPRGYGFIKNWQIPFESVEIGKAICLKKGKSIAVLSYGSIAKNVSDAITSCKNAEEISHYDFRFLNPLDSKMLTNIFEQYQQIFTVEDGVIKGGFGSAVLEFTSENNYKNPVKVLGIPHRFIKHGSIKDLLTDVGLDTISLTKEFESTD